MNSTPQREFRRLSSAAAAIAALSAPFAAYAVMVVGDANTTTVVTPTETIITATQNATLTVTEPGEIEILLVGGGGGAGGSTEKASGYTSGDSRGGGGGGGGVIHKTGFQVGVGTYFITVGAGGAVNRSNDTIDSATGGSTTRTPTAGPMPAVRHWLPPRTKTWDMQVETRSTTRLPAVAVARELLGPLVLLWAATAMLAISPAIWFTTAAAVAAVGETLRP